MDVETDEGVVSWHSDGVARVLKLKPEVLERDSGMTSKTFDWKVHSRTEADGVIDFRVTITAKSRQRVRDISLRVPVKQDVAPYMMGMIKRGGYRPASWSWSWDRSRAENMVWLGDVDAGMQIKLSHDDDIWTGDFKQLGLPKSWDNPSLILIVRL